MYNLGSEAPLNATVASGTINAANGALHSWGGKLMHAVIVHNNHASADIYAAPNEAQAQNASHKFMFTVPAGETRMCPHGWQVSQIALYSATALTLGSDYSVKGIQVRGRL